MTGQAPSPPIAGYHPRPADGAKLVLKFIGLVALVVFLTVAANRWQPDYSVAADIRTHLADNGPLGKADVADSSGTVTNNTRYRCTQTQIVGTLLDKNDAVVSRVTTQVTIDPRRTAQWRTSDPYIATGSPVTHATWLASCGDTR